MQVACHALLLLDMLEVQALERAVHMLTKSHEEWSFTVICIVPSENPCSLPGLHSLVGTWVGLLFLSPILLVGSARCLAEPYHTAQDHELVHGV